MKNFIYQFLFSFIFCAVYIPSVTAGTYEKSYVGDMEKMHTKYEDTFVHIAFDNDLGYVEMRAANPYVDPWVPGANKEIILPKRHLLPDAPREGIVINLPEQRLYFFPKDGSAPVTHPIGSGREGLNTPTGTTSIVRKTEGPVWRPTARMRKDNPELPVAVGPGPDNPLGTHALYLGWPEYLIHGTNRPFGIGRRVSSGCIRLYPSDIIDLYGKVPVGSKVTVVDQPIKLAWIDNRLYIEAHPNLEQSLAMEEMGEVEPSKLSEADLQRITKFAGDSADHVRWAAVRTAVKERRGYPIEIARRGFSEESSQDEAEEKPVTPEKKAMVKPKSAEPPKKEVKKETVVKATVSEKKKEVSVSKVAEEKKNADARAEKKAEGSQSYAQNDEQGDTSAEDEPFVYETLNQ